MKRGFILVLFALIATISYAQIPQISWNVKGGMNISNWSKGDDTKARLGYKIGGGMEYAFTDLWSVQSSLFLVSKGTRIDGEAAEIKVNQVYLEMPMMAAARFNIGNKTNIVLTAGPYIAYGIAGKTKTNVYDVGRTKENTFGDYGVKRFDFGLGTGATLEFGNILVGIEGQYGLLKTMRFEGKSPKNMSLAILVGYKF